MNRLFGVLNGVGLAFKAIRRNKLRACLTVLGILIGVAAVIAITSLGGGARESNERQIQALGSNLIFVYPVNDAASGAQSSSRAAKRLSDDDGRAILRDATSVKAVAPFLGAAAQVVFGDRNWSTWINGTTSAVLGIRNWKIERGEMWTERDESAKSRVCLIGTTVAHKLFRKEDPVGRTIRIGRFPYRVLGVLEPKGESPFGGDQDDLVLMPIGSLRARHLKTPPGFAGMFYLSAASPGVIDHAVKQIDGILRQRHSLADGRKADFEISTQKDFQAKQDAINKQVTLLLIIVAAVSLVVGGIGVMNIMLVSVTERTREIGIRMAIGACAADIRAQFLCEAVVLTLLGGAAGVLVGTGVTTVVMRVLSWPLHLNVAAVLASLTVCGLTGVTFGFVPACRAAGLDPILALKRD
jgi:putative ABC transport system permease protein